MPRPAEREFETGKDEAAAATNIAEANQSQDYDATLKNIAAQALQNAVTVANRIAQNGSETDNMVAKQAVRHGDIAIDRQWNQDEVSSLTAKTGVQQDVIQGIVAVTVAEVLSQTGK